MLFLAGRALPARGQSREAQASALFDDAKQLMSEGHYAEACPKLAQSDQLDPEVGTKVNLATCYEGLGRKAAAWWAWRDAADAALNRQTLNADTPDREKQAAREAYARARLEMLGATLPRLTIRISPGAEGGLDVRLDGEDLPSDRWDTELPVDPGTHGVAASAPGKRPWSTRFEVDEQHIMRVTITVPLLEPLPSGPASGVTPGTEGRWMRSAAIGSAAGGLSALVVGTAFGLDAIAAHNRASTNCTATWNCNREGIHELSQMRTDATIADVAFAAAGAGLIAAVVFWLGAPRGPSSRWGGMTMRPGILASGGTLSIGGVW